MLQVFIVTEYWTNISDNGGSKTTIYDNYQRRIETF